MLLDILLLVQDKSNWTGVSLPPCALILPVQQRIEG